MAVCNRCGAQIPDNSSVCPSCGAAQENNQNQAYVNQQPNYANYVNGADYTGQFDPNDIQQNKVMAILAYLGFLFIVPLLAAPNSPFARFHANQGLVLFLLDLAIGVVSVALIFIPFVGGIISSLLGIAVVVLMVLGIVNAATGSAKELPVIGKIKIIK